MINLFTCHDGEYGIVANVIETDRVFRTGAKAWICGGAGGEGWHRFVWIALSRGPRRVEKWANTARFARFRAKWIPDGLRDKIYYPRGERTAMEELAIELERFAQNQRITSPHRRHAENLPAVIP